MNVLLFDLDETLYPRSLGVVPRVDLRINRYLEERVGIVAAEVDALRRRYWAEFGTTLSGLIAHHAIDPDDYLEFIHDIEIEDLLVPDEALFALLSALPGRKAVLTNASRRHAGRVLERLGVAPAFEAVIALEDLEYVAKPASGAFERALARLAARAAGSTLIDDNVRNVAAAKKLGFRTVWVGEGTTEGADHVVGTVGELARILG
ncbi:MAG: pyrimidine 5'-nucleotidase [Candidatus Binatia bacterium]